MTMTEKKWLTDDTTWEYMFTRHDMIMFFRMGRVSTNDSLILRSCNVVKVYHRFRFSNVLLHHVMQFMPITLKYMN